MLLSGGPPSVLKDCLVAHHRQTWKLREYHLAQHEGLVGEKLRPLGSGDPLKAHFPAGTRLQELSDSVDIREPGKDVVHYRRTAHTGSDGQKATDVIILGEVLYFSRRGCASADFEQGSLRLGPVQSLRSRAST